MKCSVSYCDRDSVAKQLCAKHHKRMMKGRDINIKTYHELTLEERFFAKVEKTDSCWIWKGNARGNAKFMYGKFDYMGKVFSAHRVSWEMHNGKIPKGGDYRGICVCHSCDNPLCVNPEHLFLGAHKNNMRDKVLKRRNNGFIKQCKRGHEFSVKNTWFSKQGLRHCKECHKIRQRHYNELKAQGG